MPKGNLPKFLFFYAYLESTFCKLTTVATFWQTSQQLKLERKVIFHFEIFTLAFCIVFLTVFASRCMNCKRWESNVVLFSSYPLSGTVLRHVSAEEVLIF